MAVIAIENEEVFNKIKHPMNILGAENIINLIGENLTQKFPFNKLTHSWQEGLVNNYGEICK